MKRGRVVEREKEERNSSRSRERRSRVISREREGRHAVLRTVCLKKECVKLINKKIS
jgi:hypothetical protein